MCPSGLISLLHLSGWSRGNRQNLVRHLRGRKLVFSNCYSAGCNSTQTRCHVSVAHDGLQNSVARSRGQFQTICLLLYSGLLALVKASPILSSSISNCISKRSLISVSWMGDQRADVSKILTYQRTFEQMLVFLFGL